VEAEIDFENRAAMISRILVPLLFEAMLCQMTAGEASTASY